MRLIDAEIAYDKIAEQETSYYMDMEGVQAGLDETPTVDAAEVVRCENCKYYQKVYGGVPFGEVGHCICHSFETVPGWFCADGERREE